MYQQNSAEFKDFLRNRPIKAFADYISQILRFSPLSHTGPIQKSVIIISLFHLIKRLKPNAAADEAKFSKQTDFTSYQIEWEDK